MPYGSVFINVLLLPFIKATLSESSLTTELKFFVAFIVIVGLI